MNSLFISGRPIDDLDRACFMWRKCHDCVGEKCGGYKLNRFKQCSKLSQEILKKFWAKT